MSAPMKPTPCRKCAKTTRQCAECSHRTEYMEWMEDKLGYYKKKYKIGTVKEDD